MATCGGAQGVEVEVFGDEGPGLGQQGLQMRLFLGLHKAEVTLGQCDRGAAGQGAQHRDAGSRPSRRGPGPRGAGEATRFSTTPAKGISGRMQRKPMATAAADWAWPETSSTRTTGQPIICAMSALAPVPNSPGLATPSNRPIEPSARIRSASAATDTSPAMRSGVIAQLSRLTDARPEAAAWKAGSM